MAHDDTTAPGPPMTSHEMEELTAAEERRAAEEALIEERNAAQRAREAQGEDEQVLVLPEADERDQNG